MDKTANTLCHYGVLGMRWGIRRYQNEDGTLTEAGRRRKQKKFEKNVNKNWYKSYNKASETFDRQLRDINDRYKGEKFDSTFSTDKGQQYVKEIDSAWKNAYTSQLLNDFGRDYLSDGKEWVEHMPYMNMYVDFIRDD